MRVSKKALIDKNLLQELVPLNAIPTERFTTFDNRGYEIDLVTGEPKAKVSKGLNRFIWDMRYPNVSAIPGVPPVVMSPIAKPGTYQVRLTVDGKSQTQSFELKLNPNEVYSREQTDEKGKFWLQLYTTTEDAVQSVLAAQAAQKKVAKALEGAGSDELKAQAEVVGEGEEPLHLALVPLGQGAVETHPQAGVEELLGVDLPPRHQGLDRLVEELQPNGMERERPSHDRSPASPSALTRSTNQPPTSTPTRSARTTVLAQLNRLVMVSFPL